MFFILVQITLPIGTFFTIFNVLFVSGTLGLEVKNTTGTAKVLGSNLT